MLVRADPIRLEQVFSNLLANSAKYTPEGGQIELRASTGAGEVWVHVIDNGIGIPPETLPHVFDLFTRGDSASAQATDGLGIGLSLVREFIELHGGSVQVRSDGPGKGSEFTVRLPLADATDSMATSYNPPRSD
jgi:signal transduction histidine kinase